VVQQANEIQPEVSRIVGEIKKFEIFLNDMKDSLQKEYQMVSTEVARLRIQNNLPILGDKAISEGNRISFEEILRIIQTETEMNSLKKAAIQEIERVLRGLQGLYWPEGGVNIILDDGTVKRERETPTAILIARLSDSGLNVRGSAAVILGERKEKSVPESLLRVARADKHLRVAYHALVAFGYMTGRLEKPKGFERLNLTPVIEMFDIDKLEHWWKEHSAEVNKRLAPAESQ
jgi:hypothetical protein